MFIRSIYYLLSSIATHRNGRGTGWKLLTLRGLFIERLNGKSLLPNSAGDEMSV